MKVLLLDALNAVYVLYSVFFAISAIIFFYGLIMLYKGVSAKDEDWIRRAKFIILFAAIAMVCLAIVSFFETGKMPVN